MVLYDLLCHFRVLRGILMVFHGFISPFLAVIDPNSFGLVLLWLRFGAIFVREHFLFPSEWFHSKNKNSKNKASFRIVERSWLSVARGEKLKYKLLNLFHAPWHRFSSKHQRQWIRVAKQIFPGFSKPMSVYGPAPASFAWHTCGADVWDLTKSRHTSFFSIILNVWIE